MTNNIIMFRKYRAFPCRGTYLKAGITGRINIDWCEDHKPETTRTSVIVTITVADLTKMRKIHCTVYATGCIFKYDQAHPLVTGIRLREKAIPYSETKGYMEPMFKCYPDCMILRVRISDDLIHRNFVGKSFKQERVVNIPNSMTILVEMLPASPAMAENRINLGVISHDGVLDLYTKYIDPDCTYKNFTIEEQAKVIVDRRSNKELDTTKLMADMPEGIKNNDIKIACDLCFQRMKVNLTKMGWLPDNMPEEFKHA